MTFSDLLRTAIFSLVIVLCSCNSLANALLHVVIVAFNNQIIKLFVINTLFERN